MSKFKNELVNNSLYEFSYTNADGIVEAVGFYAKNQEIFNMGQYIINADKCFNIRPYKKELNVAEQINYISELCYKANVNGGWWEGIDVKAPMVIATKLCLIHSEISEAMEGDRKGLPDEHLPHRSMLEVELADAVIRILDLARAAELDIGGAVVEKMEYNKNRQDHKKENRNALGGKKY